MTKELVQGLIESASFFYQRGWMWGTSGNLSVRLPGLPLSLAITTSGASKGSLTLADIVVVPKERCGAEPFMPGARGKPSAETAIHLEVYRRVPESAAVFHVHTVASSALSIAVAPAHGGVAYLEVGGLEMLKGWGVGWKDGTLRAQIPVLPNREDMGHLAEDFAKLLGTSPLVPCILVAGHGITVWGKDINETRNRVEIAEFICQVLWEQRQRADKP